MDRIKFINQKRTSLKTQLTQLEKHAASDKSDYKSLKIRLNRVTELLHAYEELHDELTILDPTNERLEDLPEIQDRYYDIAGKIESMEIAGPSTSRANEPLNSTVLNATLVEGKRTLKLPVAELPKFDGTIDQWLSYKNTFLTMIDGRADITDLEKFIYLKNSLRGHALNKILIFDASAENYQKAWSLLVDAYEKRRILVSKHLDAILNIKAPEKVTSNELTRIVDHVRQHLNMLQSLGVTPDQTTVVRILENALPSEIRDKWEESLSLDTLSTLEEFYKFINETSYRLLTSEQTTGRNKAETGSKRRTDREPRAVKTRKGESGARILFTDTTGSCSYCARQHYVSNCPILRNLSISQRWDAVKQKKLCKNCLRIHRGACSSSRCKHCRRFHHSLLHRFETQATPAVQSSAPMKSTTETVKSKNSA